MAVPSLPAPVRSIDHLPDEVLVDILLRLDIPELHALSLTSHRLRRLATDPHLHDIRLHHHCPKRINSFLPLRPAILDLILRNIISHPHLQARQYELQRKLQKQLIKSRLRRRLERRPPVTDLIRRHVLPETVVAPALASRSQRLDKERSRQFLEVKILARPKPEEVRFLGVECPAEEERVSVMGLVRKFSCWDVEGGLWGRRRRFGLGKEKPARAAVWRLTRFWEKMSGSG